MATIAMVMAATCTMTTAMRWQAMKRAMARVERAMMTAIKRGMAMAARAMATAMKNAIATDGEGNVDYGKSDGDGNK